MTFLLTSCGLSTTSRMTNTFTHIRDISSERPEWLFTPNFWSHTKLSSSNQWQTNLVFPLISLTVNFQDLSLPEDSPAKSTKFQVLLRLIQLMKETDTIKPLLRKVIIFSIKFKNFQELSMFDLNCFDLM